MMYNEIGSEFWLEPMPEEENCMYMLSGRTALDLILQDILVEGRRVGAVYMPAWCCDSMLQPFIERGIEIKLYDIDWESNGSLRFTFNETITKNISEQTGKSEDDDILYVTNYFGYDTTLPEETIRLFKQRGTTIIFDRTHSLMRDDHGIYNWADYDFGSIRKWMGVITGAYVKKRSGEFYLSKLRTCPYIKDKLEAMRLKADYMVGKKHVDKKLFLDKYAQFGHNLAKDYRNYEMDIQSRIIWQFADKHAIKKTRMSNSVLLHTCLVEIPQVKPMFTLKEGDLPLFVPILLNSKEERDALRKHLTAHSIYCPIHWPKPSIIGASFKANDIFDRELSLLNDQRYGLDNMQYIIDVIKEFFEVNL